MLNRWGLLSGLFVLAFALLVMAHAAATSATYDETGHLSAGYTYVRWADYRLSPEHPPLLRKLAGRLIATREPWPGDLQTTRDDLAPRPASDSLREIKRAWARALADSEALWTFSHYFHYGPTASALERFGVTDPLRLPTTARLDESDFLNDADRLLFRGRMATLGLGVLLAVLIFLWGRDLWGPAGGALATALFCFEPNFIAHSGLVTTDVGVTAFMFGALYFLWKTCRRIRAASVALTLLFIGLALASKFTSLLLAPIFAILVLGRACSNDAWPLGAGPRALATRGARMAAAAGLSLAALATAYLSIWATYDFRYSAARDPAHAASLEAILPDLDPAGQATRWRDPGHFPIEFFVRRAAAMQSLLHQREGVTPASFRARTEQVQVGPTGRLLLFAQRHRVLPEAYLHGLATTRLFSLARKGFLRGETSDTGFWSYFLWTLALKTPLVTLVAIAAGVIFAMRRRDPWLSRTAFLLVPVAVYWSSVLGSSFNIGHRHLLPVYPFLFVLAGGLAVPWSTLSAGARPAVAVLALLAIAAGGQVVWSPPWRPSVIHPHYLAYFNELAGGPREGYKSLTDSNLDWGQDLKALSRWLRERGIDEPIHLCYFGSADPRYYQIRHVNVPKALGGYAMGPAPYDAFEDKKLYEEAFEQFGRALRPGQYLAISATNLAGVYQIPANHAIWQHITQHSTLVDRVGYSIFIYRLGAL